MNGRRYFGEVHIVHYEDEYDNLTAALEDAKGDGVAVLGYFIDIRSEWTSAVRDALILFSERTRKNLSLIESFKPHSKNMILKIMLAKYHFPCWISLVATFKITSGKYSQSRHQVCETRNDIRFTRP